LVFPRYYDVFIPPGRRTEGKEETIANQPKEPSDHHWVVTQGIKFRIREAEHNGQNRRADIPEFGLVFPRYYDVFIPPGRRTEGKEETIANQPKEQELPAIIIGS
jgi:hypothetical protein